MADAPKDAATTINFDYVKGTGFRVLHADGAFMAAAPNGLTLAFYSERQPIPRRVVQRVTPNRELVEIPEQRVVRDAIVRDVEVTFTMSLQVAKNIHKTLGEIIGKVDDAIKEQGAK